MANPSTEDPIVVIKLGALGDIVRTSYVIAAMARTTTAPIVWVTRRGGVDLIRLNPSIAQVLAIEDGTFPPRASHVISLDDEMEAVKVAGSIQTPRLTGAFLRADGQIDYSENSRPWFDMGLVSRFGKSVADEMKRTNLRSHSEIFSEMLDVQGVSPVFYGDEEEERGWRDLRRNVSVMIGFNLFAGARWPSKEIPDNEALKLLEMVHEDISASRPSDMHLIALMVDKSNFARGERLKNLSSTRIELWDTGKSVLSFAGAISACDYLFSADSLGLHLAIAQRVPNLSYYAPTSAAEIDTFGTGVKVRSDAPDYCSYKANADNRSLTAERLFSEWKSHIKSGALDARR